MQEDYIRKAIVTNVVDGDTLDAIVDLGYAISTVQRFRLLGIDTPERGQQGFAEAKNFVRDTLLGKEVLIKSQKSDSFGRYLAIVYYQDNNVNEMLLTNGLAKDYKR